MTNSPSTSFSISPDVANMSETDLLHGWFGSHINLTNPILRKTALIFSRVFEENRKQEITNESFLQYIHSELTPADIFCESMLSNQQFYSKLRDQLNGLLLIPDPPCTQATRIPKKIAHTLYPGQQFEVLRQTAVHLIEEFDTRSKGTSVNRGKSGSSSQDQNDERQNVQNNGVQKMSNEERTTNNKHYGPVNDNEGGNSRTYGESEFGRNPNFHYNRNYQPGVQNQNHQHNPINFQQSMPFNSSASQFNFPHYPHMMMNINPQAPGQGNFAASNPLWNAFQQMQAQMNMLAYQLQNQPHGGIENNSNVNGQPRPNTENTPDQRTNNQHKHREHQSPKYNSHIQPEQFNRNESNSHKTHNDIALRYRESNKQYSGADEEDLEEFISKYNIHARDCKLNDQEKLQYFHNMFRNDAWRVYNNSILPRVDTFESACTLTRKHFNPENTQTRIKDELSTLRLEDFSKKEGSTRGGLKKLIAYIRDKSALCPESHRHESHRVDFLKEAIIGNDWADSILSKVDNNTSYQSLGNDLLKKLQFEEKKKLKQGSMKKPTDEHQDDSSDEERKPKIFFTQPKYTKHLSKTLFPGYENSNSCWNCDKPGHKYFKCHKPIDYEKIATRKISYLKNKKHISKSSATKRVLYEVLSGLDELTKQNANDISSSETDDDNSSSHSGESDTVDDTNRINHIYDDLTRNCMNSNLPQPEEDF